MKLISGSPQTLGPGELGLFAVCRNEESRLPYWLKHYKDLGIDHAYIVCNDTTDKSISILKRHPEVSVFETEKSFSQSSFGRDWLETLQNTYAMDRWCIQVDCDEFVKFESDERYCLKSYIEKLEVENYSAIHAILLDMFSSHPIEQTYIEPGRNPIEVCNFFDADNLLLGENTKASLLGTRPNCIIGGVRKRVFGLSPNLSKVPLFKKTKGTRLFPGAHFIEGNSVKVGDSVVFHFKYVEGFNARVNEEALREQHFGQASEYKAYRQTINTRPDLTLWTGSSVKYTSSSDLKRLVKPWKLTI